VDGEAVTEVVVEVGSAAEEAEGGVLPEIVGDGVGEVRVPHRQQSFSAKPFICRRWGQRRRRAIPRSQSRRWYGQRW
jgi:hypothetical protein